MLTYAAENAINFARYRGYRGHPVDPSENTSVTIIGEYRCGLVVIHLEARFDGLRAIIGAPNKLRAAATVADAVALWPMGLVVKARPALRASETPREPVDERGLVDIEQDHVIQL